ncbi:MAG: metalloregulator ArsR/SmtB family transcription factor [Cellulomonadaceae bacterium]|jgi:ArsR family transcriptional regulator|nr:metalloregulator ArsR/SmtB family transcription factor [Cellulomonadaceae bacterium]
MDTAYLDEPLDTRPLYEIKANLFKALAHPARLQVLEVLAADSELTAPVGKLLEFTGTEPSALSQHLAVLKNADIVKSWRTGNIVHYQLTEPLIAELLVVSRAFLLLRLTGDAAVTHLDALRHLPALPGGTAQAVLDAAVEQFEHTSHSGR